MKEAARNHIVWWFSPDGLNSKEHVQARQLFDDDEEGYYKRRQANGDGVRSYDKWTKYAETISSFPQSGVLALIFGKSISSYQTSRRSPLILADVLSRTTVLTAFYFPRDVEFELSYDWSFNQEKETITWKMDEHSDYQLDELLALAKAIPTGKGVEDDPSYVRVQWAFPFAMSAGHILRPKNTDETVHVYLETASVFNDSIAIELRKDPRITAWAHWGTQGVRWSTEMVSVGAVCRFGKPDDEANDDRLFPELANLDREEAMVAEKLILDDQRLCTRTDPFRAS